MGIPLPITTKLDERSATAQADKAEQIFADAGRNAGRQFSDAMDSGLRGSEEKLKRVADTASDAYDKMRDAAGRTRAEEERLQELRERGARNSQVVSQAERLEKARRAEARAVRDAVDAYNEYHSAAGKAAEDSEKFGTGLSAAFRRAVGTASDAGSDSADSFMGGFAGASALTRIGAAAGPVGVALAAVTALGYVTGRKLVEQIELGMASLNMKDTFAAKMGVDDATMAQYGSAAGKAFTDQWGTSVEDNLSAVQFAIQGGLIDRNATDADIQHLIAQIQTVSTVVGEDSQTIARGVRNFIKTGLADSTEEALNLIVSASQRGLNISGDLLDTFEEYGTKFRDMGLSGADALGLINQMWEAGIRNTDVAADSLKEFAIRAVDGSETTRGAFGALGFDADDMARRFAAGGDTARQAFGEVLTAINGMHDPLQQELAGVALFGTKWEDAGDAIKGADLDTAASQMGQLEGATDRATQKLGEHTSGWLTLDRQIDQTFSNLREWLADSAIGRFFDQTVPGVITDALQNGGFVRPFVGPMSERPEAAGGDSIYGGPNASRQRRGVGEGAAGPPITRTTPVPIVPGGAAGGGGSSALTLPYPAEYGQPARPGETDQQYQARMADILARHNLAQAEARVNQLNGEATKDANAVVAAQNAVTEARMRSDQAARQYQESLLQQVQPGGLAVPYSDAYGAGPRAGQTSAQYGAEGNMIEAQRKKAQAEQNYQQLQQSGTATAQQLADAYNKLVEATRAEHEQALRLSEAYKDNAESGKKASEALGDIGNQLDADFGISKGLAGIAENITRFVAGLAFAPVIGALKGVQAANGGYDANSMGAGMMGLVGGAMGMGPQAAQSSGMPMVSTTYPTPIYSYSPTGAPGPMTTPVGPMSMSNLPSILNDTGSVPSGPQSRNAAAIIQQLWGDQLRGKIGGSRDNNTAENTHDAGLAIDIPIGPDQMALGDEINAYLQQNAEQLGLKYSIWRDHGQNVGGGSFTVPGHQNHIDAQFNGQPGAQSSTMPPSMASASGATPVYVVNMPGGGMGIGSSAYSAGEPGASASSFGGTSQSGIAGYIADKAAAAGYSASDAQAFVAQTLGESNLDPTAYGANTGDATGGASGIFQFTPGTWAQFGAGGDPLNARDNIDAYFRLAEARDPGQGDMRSRLAQISVGGPAVPANNAPWDSYMNQSRGLIGDRFGAATARGGGTGGGIGPGMAGLPQSAPFGPAAGSPVGGPASPGQSVMGGRAYGQGTPASGGLGFGGGLIGMAGSAASGAIGLATSGAAMGMDGGMGGAAASAVAQIGIQQIQRAIGAGAQYAGALAGGLLETFSLNDSALGDPSKSWLGKIAGVVAGVRPSLPNTAGKQGGEQNPNMAEAGKDQPPALTPQQAAEQKAADAANGGQGQGANGTTINNNVSVTNQRATEDYTGQVVQAHLGAQAMAGQPR